MVDAAAGPPADHHAQSLTDIPPIPPTAAALAPDRAAAASTSNYGQWGIIAALVIPVVLVLLGLALRPALTRRGRDAEAPATH